MLGACLRCDDTELSGDVEKPAGERALRVLPEDRATSFQARLNKKNDIFGRFLSFPWPRCSFLSNSL